MQFCVYACEYVSVCVGALIAKYSFARVRVCILVNTFRFSCVLFYSISVANTADPWW